MNDSDPRPMPPQVLAAYRDPLDLRALLASSVFTDSDRLEVRDELLERLIAKHGNVEVEIGKGLKTLPIHKRVAQFKKNAWGSIEILLQAEEFGGREAVLLELATIMQPYWARWWDLMQWNEPVRVVDSFAISSFVLGQRQLTWLAAQYARSVVNLASTTDQLFCLEAIEAAEDWSTVPSRINQDRALRSSSVAYAVARASVRTSNIDNYVARSAARAAGYTDAHADDADNAVAVVNYVADVRAFDSALQPGFVYTPNANADSFRTTLKDLCSLTKQLISPTLITRASRGLR